MFRSLRFRLWFSYLFVFAVSFLVVLVGLIWAVQRSPFFYRQTALNIQLSGALITLDLQDTREFNQGPLTRLLADYAQKHQVSTAVLNGRGEVVARSGFISLPAMARLRIHMANEENFTKVFSYRDAEGKTWFYSAFPLNAKYILLVAAPRPRIGLLILLRQEFEPVFLLALILALFLALVISIFMANWIGSPLRHFASATRKLADGEYQKIPLQGPEDIRQVAVTFNEMTERVKSSQQSQQDFIANVSHELKTPLTSIQGFAQAILDGTVDSQEELDKAAEIIYEESGRMHRLVNDLLSLSRLESGLAHFEFTDVRIDVLLSKVMERFLPQCQEKHIDSQLPLDVCAPVNGDTDSLAQLFGNLIGNAVKFSPENEAIILQAKEMGHMIEVRVTNAGPGIPGDEKKRIFERFYQVDKARSGGIERGVGLGLAISKQIVLAHNGTIRVEDSPSSGTVFIVNLPVSSKTKE